MAQIPFIYNTYLRNFTYQPYYSYHTMPHPYCVTPFIHKNCNIVYCANCGGIGHIYKQCNHPITSFGVICFRLVFNHKSKRIMPQYLMVQRRDSLSYVEYIRGKYNYENRAYILKLFENMTVDERERIRTQEFEQLWKSLWQINDASSYQREYNDSKVKFNMLKSGYIMKNSSGSVFFNLEYVLDNTTSTLDQTEWGFPKGRRNINEDDFSCAFREFSEETGIGLDQVHVFDHIKPFEEVFSGSNHIRYKHIYYMAISLTSSATVRVNPKNRVQCKEVKDVKWFWHEDAQKLIRDCNVERKELFRRVNQVIEKNISMINKRNGPR